MSDETKLLEFNGKAFALDEELENRWLLNEAGGLEPSVDKFNVVEECEKGVSRPKLLLNAVTVA